MTLTATTDAPLIDGQRKAMAALVTATSRIASISAWTAPRKLGPIRVSTRSRQRPRRAPPERPHVQPAPAADGDAQVARRAPAVVEIDRPRRPRRAQLPGQLREQALWLAQVSLQNVRCAEPPTSRSADRTACGATAPAPSRARA
jgi:hypothetical protein